MSNPRLSTIISKAINPSRVFIALMLAVSIWLLFTFIPNETPNASGRTFVAAGGECENKWDCSNGHCCGGECYDDACGGGETIQPPAISGSLTCSQPGNGDWCIGGLVLNLIASDPQNEPVIISGTVNGQEFACRDGDTTCLVPISIEGNGTINYIVHSKTELSAGDSATYQLDLSTPQIDGTLKGASGTPPWFVSDVEFSASATDAVSGLASLEISADSGAYLPDNPITLSDGIHTVTTRAFDYAGNVTESTQTVNVDTITPTLSIVVNGTQGKNNWYVSAVQVSAVFSDDGSGVASVEVSSDGAAYVPYTSPASFSDGHHTYQFKVKDKAGNVTESMIYNIKIDTIAPVIDMPETLLLGETLYYSLEDPSTSSGELGSGLATYRTVIQDDAEKYKKITWLDSISGDKLKDQFLWDGIFKDGVKADVGEYFITLKTSDAAGNETMKTTVVNVNLPSLAQDLPVFTPPINAITDDEAMSEDQVPGQTFDNTNSGTAVEITSSSISIGGTRADGANRTTLNWVTKPVTNAPALPISDILWGSAATALVGATLAEWKRQRDEAALAVRLAYEERAADQERRKNGYEGPSTYRQIAKAYQRSVDNFKADLINDGFSVDEAQKLKSQAISNGFIPSARELVQEHKEKEEKLTEALRQKVLGKEAKLVAADEVAEEQRKAEELQAGLAAYYQGRKAGEVAVTPPKEKTSKWENAWNWAFKYQAELSLGTGVLVGAAVVVAVAVAAVVTSTIVAPVLAIGGAVLATAALVTAGTMALNNHFNLGLGNNLAKNLILGTGAALLTTGLGLLLVNYAPLFVPVITKACVDYQTVCNQVGTFIDKGEEALLAGQITYYNWIGDQDKAAQTTIELQLELMDGNAPGNTAAKELGDQIANLGPDALEIAGKYGDEAIPLLFQYGTEAVDIINAYGDEGIALLIKFGDDTWEVIRLVKQFGTPAVNLLKIVDPASANKLLKTLDADVLEYAMTKNSDAVFALSRWSEKELKEFGPELALRAEKDAKVLKAIDSLVRLVPIDPKHLTTEQDDLIKIIAENSMQYSDEGQIVLGKWVDYGNGFTSYARETGSVHYNPHPDMWNLLGSLGKQRDDTAWLVNEKVIQIGIDKKLPFEYTLNGLPSDKIEFEESAIEKIWEGGLSKEIIYNNVKESLSTDTIPIRTKELVELYFAGYVYSFDSVANSYVFIKP